MLVVNPRLVNIQGHPFRKLDALRELLATDRLQFGNPMTEVLDGFRPPRIVVVGDEGAGKSTILEQLAKLPLLPRRRTMCTRLAIHMRLRRSPDESSVTLAVYKEPIPQENGWLWVQKESKGQCGDSGVVFEKILVLEVPSIDLVDLPGLAFGNSHKASDKAESVTRILDKHLQEDVHNMPMLVVEAHKLPNTSPAVHYIMEKQLQDLGGIRMKCWIASMQGPEKQGEERAKEFATHNFERENAFFANISELQDLQEKGHAGIPCLVEKLHKEYLNHLHLSWKWDAFYKLEAKLDRLQFDLSMLGVVSEEQKQQLASAEALYQSFVADVLQKGLFERISHALLQFQGEGYMCEGYKQQSAIDRACAEIRKITDEALKAVSSQLVEPLREILQTESKVTHAPESLRLEPLQTFAEGKRWKSNSPAASKK
ncbi:mx1 [Symbiodinium sp. KB8]|nr:mx1 [Symbiodinium sp. KB8]